MFIKMNIMATKTHKTHVVMIYQYVHFMLFLLHFLLRVNKFSKV